MSFSLRTVVDLQHLKRPATVAVVYGLLLFAIFPRGVPALNDDFGYLKSVIQTLQHNRPWTDDWLEPWSASFSIISAIVFCTTHSFYLSTYGVLAALGALAFWGGILLFQARAFRPTMAVGITALLLTFPTALWKSMEFTGLALYLPCVLWVLLSSEQNKWGWFTFFWLIAFSSRQSAVVWGVLPAVELIRLTRSRQVDRKIKIGICGAVLLSGLALFLMLKYGMNKTHAQAAQSGSVLGNWPGVTSLGTIKLGMGIFLCSVGISRFLLRQKRGIVWNQFTFLRAGTVIGLLGVAYVITSRELQSLQIEHTLFSGPVGSCYLLGLLAIATVGWMSGNFSLRIDYVLAALASMLLVSTRETVWDYYFIDTALFGLFASHRKSDCSAEVNKPEWKALTPLAFLGICNIVFLFQMKGTLDRGWALCDLTERSLRAGKMRRAELSFAPFGYTAWHLYPYYVAHERKNDPRLDSFGRYLIPGAVEVGQGYSKALHIFPRFRHEPPSDRTHLIAWGEYRYMWLFHAKFFLLRFRTEQDNPPVDVLPAADEYFSDFPLDDREWSQYLKN